MSWIFLILIKQKTNETKKELVECFSTNQLTLPTSHFRFALLSVKDRLRACLQAIFFFGTQFQISLLLFSVRQNQTDIKSRTPIKTNKHLLQKAQPITE